MADNLGGGKCDDSEHFQSKRRRFISCRNPDGHIGSSIRNADAFSDPNINIYSYNFFHPFCYTNTNCFTKKQILVGNILDNGRSTT